MILGITGGIASGKSTVSNFLRELGMEILDADILSREVIEEKVNKKALLDIFGSEIFIKKNNENIIDRKKIREMVFNNKKKLEMLNNLIHPKIIEKFENRKKISEKLKNKEIIIFDIPLLFEKKLEYLCDYILTVYTEKNIQIERIIERDKSNYNLAVKIIDSQMDICEKVKKSDFTINNSGTREELKDKLNNILKEIITLE
ncbi:MAG: dephospho-CoA kinase [Fusobacteriaceae bacterium]